MPGLIDKVIINNNSIKGMNAAIAAEFDSMQSLGKEIIDNQLLKAAEPIKDKLKKACEEYDAAQLKFLSCQRACIAEMAKLIDDKVV